MSPQAPDQSELPKQLSDLLWMLDKGKKKIPSAKGIDKKGKIKTAEPTAKNQAQFMQADKHGDIFSNFFSNFFKQLKNPTHFSFFNVFKVTTQDKQTQENQNNMETKQETGENRYKLEQIDWETMNNLGLSKEKLEKMNLLEPLLKGYKTNELVPVSVHLEGAVSRMDARLSLQQNEEGKVIVAIHGIRKEPNLNFAFFGHTFSDEDKKNLLETRNMGRVVDLTHPKTGETIPSMISVDRLTNELIALRTDKIKIPDEIKGVKLDDAQKQTLMEGKALYVEGMISKKGETFGAQVQFNADKRYVEFLFDNGTKPQQSQSNEKDPSQSQAQEAPKTFRGKELDDAQYEKFKAGQTIYLDDLVDKKGQKYQGYITFDKETQKINFSFQSPNKLVLQAKPTEAHQTQTAVNSEGKSNEATKHIDAPLKPAQQSPNDKKQQEQLQEAAEPTKSKGRKM